MNRINCLKALWRQGLIEIFFANAIDAVASKFLSPLTDKDSMLIWWFCNDAVFTDEELEELSGFIIKRYKPESIAFSKDGNGLLMRVEVVEVECCDFTGPCP